ncbi:esterase/lipase family protein [Stieleria varia]|uniref:Alpha/beta hydrolase family protein n=1 Tax=Stieleria varia TaxID=2528005 RepID=A0A5C6ASK8_9BACT|nr:alpha/beta fold hydrolase [Stieleria varia]TWU01184.1 Alpha/beta hydrolase family protein [Stieleria varia]
MSVPAKARVWRIAAPLASSLVIFFLFQSSTTAWAQMKNTSVANSPSDLIEIQVPIRDGKIVWADVAEQVAQSVKLDRASVAKLFPSGSLDAHAPATVFALIGMDLAFGDAMSVRLVTDRLGETCLQLRCSREVLGLSQRNGERRPASIGLDSDWKERTSSVGGRQRPLIVCLHGLKSHGERFAALRNFLRQDGYATASLSYDDRQSIHESASELSRLIRNELAGSDGLPPIVLVGHSMGGLVAREWTEDPALAGESVVGLITVGTPHQGSNWAAMPPLLDLFFVDDFDASDILDVLLHQPSEPGLRDLVPDSEFLRTLNARPRRSDVSYLTIAGTASPVSETEVSQLRDLLRSLDTDGGFVRVIRPRIAPLLDSFDEVIQGKGDGVVSVESASLTGVDKPLIVNRSHIDFFQPSASPNRQPVWNAIRAHLDTCSRPR